MRERRRRWWWICRTRASGLRSPPNAPLPIVEDPSDFRTQAVILITEPPADGSQNAEHRDNPADDGQAGLHNCTAQMVL
jgi:hypothetical protein